MCAQVVFEEEEADVDDDDDDDDDEEDEKRSIYCRIKIARYCHKIKTNDANLQNDDSRLAEQEGEQKKKKKKKTKKKHQGADTETEEEDCCLKGRTKFGRRTTI